MKRRRRPSSSHERAPGGRRAPQCQVGEQSQVGKEWWENSKSGSPSRRALGSHPKWGKGGGPGRREARGKAGHRVPEAEPRVQEGRQLAVPHEPAG